MAKPQVSTPTMFECLSDIFESVVPREDARLDVHEWPILLERAQSGCQIDQALRAVFSILRYLEANSPKSLIPTTKILANGSRYGEPPFESPYGRKEQDESIQLKSDQSHIGCHLATRRYWIFTSIFLPKMKMNRSGHQMRGG